MTGCPGHEPDELLRRRQLDDTQAVRPEVQLAESQLLKLASLVNPHHSWAAVYLDRSGRALTSADQPDRTWTDPVAAGELGDLLRTHEPGVYLAALANAAERGNLRAVLKSAIKLGRPESLLRLKDMLDRYGSKEIMEDYLNSGSPYLREAAQNWAYKRGYIITSFPGGSQGGRWGSR